ncbi:MAG TPA: DUF5916 domain-containing protein [Longimicrobiales bacterium]|nr:DUF5916 domain-containing protein [Longimicrobiales bacterium]
MRPTAPARLGRAARACAAACPLLAALALVPERAAARQQLPSAGEPAGGEGVPLPPLLDASVDLGPMRVDGVLDEPEWARAAVFSGFTQMEPIEGEPGEHDTEVRVLFGEGAVWVGARMWDDEPERIDTRLTRRDGLGTFDQFRVEFDPNLDGLTAYSFGVTAAGVQSDSYIYDDDQVDNAWDAVWSSAVSIDERGWVAELRIPLSQLRYDASDLPQTWGINFNRQRFASNERSSWMLVSRLRRGIVSQMGRIDNVIVSRPARRLELLPYVVSSLHRAEPVQRDPYFDGTAGNARVGLDLSYGLGTAFTLDATINPDFGQVEADPAVINLSAFETFFEERRPFFVEDARVFDFTLSGGRNQLFYSRRIGRSPHGDPPDDAEFHEAPEAATILGAAKLSGRTQGGLSVGALAAVTAAEHGEALLEDGTRVRFQAEPRTEYGVVSLARDFREGASQIGVLATAMRRELPSDGAFEWLPSSAYSAGVRFNHQWSDRDWAVFGYFSGSHVRGSAEAITRIQRSSIHYFQRPDATRFALDSTATSIGGVDWRLTIAKQNGEHWTGSVWAAEVTNGFEVNDLGFSTRSEVLDGGAALTYREIRPGRIFRSYDVGVRTFHNWSHEALDDPWRIASWHGARTGGNYSLNAGGELLNYWSVRASVAYEPPQMSRRATRGGPVMALPSATSFNLNLSSDRRRRVSFGAFFAIRRDDVEFGSGRNLGVDLRLRPSDNLSISLNPSYSVSRASDQYVTATAAAPYAPTLGTRYLFADLEQRTFSMDTRVDWTFSPTLSLQLYAQPLLSSGDYLRYKQLAAPRTFDFIELDPPLVDGERHVDFDGDGAVDYVFEDRDFNVRSLIGNLVLRWEYRPGSALFLVWQRAQSDEALAGELDLGRDARRLFRAPAEDRFIVKVSYWLGL